MPELTAEGRRIVGDVARRHSVSEGAVVELLAALVAGGGSQAQFNHPDLGGMGQWSQGGMVMVGDIFNNALKARVDARCAELAGLLRAADPFAPAVASRQSQSQGQPGGIGVSLFVPGSLASAEWWPAELGSPAAKTMNVSIPTANRARADQVRRRTHNLSHQGSMRPWTRWLKATRSGIWNLENFIFEPGLARSAAMRKPLL